MEEQIMVKKYAVKNNNTIIAKKAHNKLDYYLRSLAGDDGYTGALKAPVRCFGNHLSGKGKSSFQTDNECSGAAILKK